MNEEKVAYGYLGISLTIYLASKVFPSYGRVLTSLNIHLFLLLLFCYSMYFTIAVIRNWESFRKAYKPIDLTIVFGDVGRILYMLIGILLVVLSVYLFCIYHRIIR